MFINQNTKFLQVALSFSVKNFWITMICINYSPFFLKNHILLKWRIFKNQLYFMLQNLISSYLIYKKIAVISKQDKTKLASCWWFDFDGTYSLIGPHVAENICGYKQILVSKNIANKTSSSSVKYYTWNLAYIVCLLLLLTKRKTFADSKKNFNMPFNWKGTSI